MDSLIKGHSVDGRKNSKAPNRGARNGSKTKKLNEVLLPERKTVRGGNARGCGQAIYEGILVAANKRR